MLSLILSSEYLSDLVPFNRIRVGAASNQQVQTAGAFVANEKFYGFVFSESRNRTKVPVIIGYLGRISPTPRLTQASHFS
jgi:hypothetical protein